MTDKFEDLALRSIQSQYGNAPRIKALVAAMAERIDPYDDIDLFYDKIFNPLTAEGWGLDIWGRIVGVPRTITALSGLEWFGYDGSLLQPFNQAPFWNEEYSTGQYDLTDPAYRALILYKSVCNISDDSVASLNTNLRYLYSEGRFGTAVDVYVTEPSAMSIVVNIDSSASLVQLKVLQTYGMFNKPAGVTASINLV